MKLLSFFVPGPTFSARSVVASSTDLIPWRFFLVAVAGTVLIHAVTLTRSPPAWQDEVQIIDYGRPLLPESDSSYGVNWSAHNRPIKLIPYLGGLLQEVGYRSFSAGNTGARIAALAGAVLAAFAMRAWLAAAAISPWMCSAAGCALLWDPLLSQSYRGARVDAACMASMMTAFWCIRRSSLAIQPLHWLFPAGACIAVSGLTWASAILLVPLLLYEIYQSLPAASGTSGSKATFVIASAFTIRTFVVGACAAAWLFLLLLPFTGQLGDMVADLNEGVVGVVGGQRTRYINNLAVLPSLFLARSPWLPLAAMVGIVSLGPRSWFLPFVAAVCFCVATRPYGHRVVYLVPYFVYGFALVVNRLSCARAPHMRGRRVAQWLAIVILVWAAGVSMAGRTCATLWDWNRRDPELATKLVDRLPGGPGTKVLLGSWNLYYPVRARRWHYWGPYDQRSLKQIIETFDYDYVIRDEADGPQPLDEFLETAGYVRHVIHSAAARRGALSKPVPGYGPYVVYSRPDLRIVPDGEGP